MTGGVDTLDGAIFQSLSSRSIEASFRLRRGHVSFSI